MSNQLFFSQEDSCTLGIMSKASAKAWTPRRVLPFILCLYVTRASAIATSTAPAPGTTQPSGGKTMIDKDMLYRKTREKKQQAIKVCSIILPTSEIYLNIYRNKISCTAQ